MTSERDTAVQKLESKMLQQMLGRPTRDKGNKMCGAIAAVYAEAKTSHNNFPLGSKFGFSAAILNKDKYIALHNTLETGIAATSNLATTWLFIQPRRVDMYDNNIFAVHPNVSLRKKEAQCSELINQYEIFVDTRRNSKTTYSSPEMKYILSQLKTNYLGFPEKLSPKCSTISSSNTSP